MTCSYETREVTGAGDWLAHNPEVVARAVPAGLVRAKHTAAGANLCIGRPQCYVRSRIWLDEMQLASVPQPLNFTTTTVGPVIADLGSQRDQETR